MSTCNIPITIANISRSRRATLQRLSVSPECCKFEQLAAASASVLLKKHSILQGRRVGGLTSTRARQATPSNCDVYEKDDRAQSMLLSNYTLHASHAFSP